MSELDATSLPAMQKFDHVEEDEKETPDCEVMDYIQQAQAVSPPLHPVDITPHPSDSSGSPPLHHNPVRANTSVDDEVEEDEEDDEEDDEEEEEEEEENVDLAAQKIQHDLHPLRIPSSSVVSQAGTDHSFLGTSQNGSSDIMDDGDDDDDDPSPTSSSSNLTRWQGQVEDPLDRVLGKIVAKVPDFGLMTLSEPVMDSFADFIRWNFDSGVIDHGQMRSMLQNLDRLYDVVLPTPPDMAPAGIMQAEHHLQALARAMKDVITGVSIRRRKFMLKHYHDVFVARSAVTWMVERGFARDRQEGTHLGKALLAHGYIRHVSGMKNFKDKKLFFIFNDKENVSLQFPDGKNPFCASMLNLVYHIFESTLDEWMESCSLDALRLAYPIVFTWTAFRATKKQATKIMHGFCQAVGKRDDFHVAMIGFLRANDDIMETLMKKCVDMSPCCPSHGEAQHQEDGGWTAVLTPTKPQAATLDFMSDKLKPGAAASMYEARRTVLVNPFTGDEVNIQLRKIYKTSARPSWIRFIPPQSRPALYRSSSVSGKIFTEAIASYHNVSPSPSSLSFSLNDDSDTDLVSSLHPLDLNTRTQSHTVRNGGAFFSPARRKPIQTRSSKFLHLHARPPRSPAIPVAVQQQNSQGKNLAQIDTAPQSSPAPKAVLASPRQPGRQLWSEDAQSAAPEGRVQGRHHRESSEDFQGPEDGEEETSLTETSLTETSLTETSQTDQASVASGSETEVMQTPVAPHRVSSSPILTRDSSSSSDRDDFGSQPETKTYPTARRSSLPSSGSGGRSVCAVCESLVCFSCSMPHCPNCNPERAPVHLDSHHQIIPLQNEEAVWSRSPSHRSDTLSRSPPSAISVRSLEQEEEQKDEEQDLRMHPFMHSGDLSSCAAPRLRRGKVTDAIAKYGDDLRQDQSVQLIFACCSAFLAASPNIWRFGRSPYARTIEVVVTGKKSGFIEFLKGQVIKDVAKSGGWNKVNLKRWAPSAIGQLVMSFILGIRDRHEENWLLLGDPDQNPEMVQIDFGYILNAPPGGLALDTPRMSLQSQVIDLMKQLPGNKAEETMLDDFIHDLREAFRVIRAYHPPIVALCKLALHGIAKPSEVESWMWGKNVFRAGLSEEAAIRWFEDKARNDLSSFHLRRGVKHALVRAYYGVKKLV